MTEINETGITWNHDTGTVFVSTRRKGISSKLQKLGFEPEDAHGYVNFTAHENDLRISFRRPKKLSAIARKKVAERLANARKTA